MFQLFDAKMSNKQIETETGLSVRTVLRYRKAYKEWLPSFRIKWEETRLEVQELLEIRRNEEVFKK